MNADRKTARQTFIDDRAAALMAAGWHETTAQKRAAKEWRKISPQHVAAVKRNAAMRQARNERLAALPYGAAHFHGNATAHRRVCRTRPDRPQPLATAPGRGHRPHPEAHRQHRRRWPAANPDDALNRQYGLRVNPHDIPKLVRSGEVNVRLLPAPKGKR